MRLEIITEGEVQEGDWVVPQCHHLQLATAEHDDIGAPVRRFTVVLRPAPDLSESDAATAAYGMGYEAGKAKARAENERLRELPSPNGEVYALLDENDALKAENERLREALKEMFNLAHPAYVNDDHFRSKIIVARERIRPLLNAKAALEASK